MTRSPLPRIARLTGAAYLGVVCCGIFAEFFVRGSLVVPGDATATATQIADAPSFFALGIGADLLMVLLDVGVAYGLYRLLASVHCRLAIAATAFRLLQASVLALNLSNLVKALGLSADPASAPEVLAAVETHALRRRRPDSLRTRLPDPGAPPPPRRRTALDRPGALGDGSGLPGRLLRGRLRALPLGGSRPALRARHRRRARGRPLAHRPRAPLGRRARAG